MLKNSGRNAWYPFLADTIKPAISIAGSTVVYFLIKREIHAITDATGHMNRPGAGPSSYSLSLNGIPINHYINHNPQTGRVEIVKPMPPGVDDWLVKDFADEGSARAWATLEFNAGRLG
jgi:hypothetical protein